MARLGFSRAAACTVGTQWRGKKVGSLGRGAGTGARSREDARTQRGVPMSPRSRGGCGLDCKQQWGCQRQSWRWQDGSRGSGRSELAGSGPRRGVRGLQGECAGAAGGKG